MAWHAGYEGGGDAVYSPTQSTEERVGVWRAAAAFPEPHRINSGIGSRRLALSSKPAPSLSPTPRWQIDLKSRKYICDGNNMGSASPRGSGTRLPPAWLPPAKPVMLLLRQERQPASASIG